MKIQYKDYLIIKENNTVKITNGIGTIVIDKELLKILEEVVQRTIENIGGGS